MFAVPKTQYGLFMRHFCGWRNAESATAGNAKSDVGEDYFALRVIDFVASEMGAPALPITPTIPWSFNVKLRGKTLEVVNLLNNWPEVFAAAQGSWSSYKTENTEWLAEAEVAILRGDPETLHAAALYNNCTRSFRKHPYEHILCNFRLAALALGWYFAGYFDTSKNFVLQGLKDRGFREKIEAQETTITTGMKDIKNLNLPLKLALFISPLVLLLPKPLATWTFHNGQLVYIYKTLQDSRPRPGQLMRVEGIAMKEVWKVAQGIKIAEKALADFFVEASAVPCNSDFRFANQFAPPTSSPLPPPPPPPPLAPPLPTTSIAPLLHSEESSSLSKADEPSIQTLEVESALNAAFRNNESSGQLDPDKDNEDSSSTEEDEPPIQILDIEFALNAAFGKNESSGRLDPGQHGNESSSESSISDEEERSSSSEDPGHDESSTSDEEESSSLSEDEPSPQIVQDESGGSTNRSGRLVLEPGWNDSENLS
ncbi:hypothetical protein C8F04DRAFT_1253321 [Mycena alexandri]|uniref:Uncharacterized protein n=1 Tax=Mycena alexandri TaxID=1745969 RepID=A0AAD6X951_9AGAR|nr:hypothetical protein C8F04DRAFT_1253321 [Mycena alexandri]